MKQIRKMKLNTRLLAVFFAAVILLSLMHFFVYTRLLVNMEKEEYTINDHLLSSVTLKVDAVLAELRGQYLDLTGTEVFRNAAAVSPSDYRLTQMHAQASSSLNGSQFIGGWAVFFREGDKIVSSNGCYPLEMYSDSFFVNETYTAEFWLERINEKFSRRFFPEARFQNAGYNGASMDMDLVPLALKGYWDSDMMMVLFLDMEEICAEADRYLEEGTYVFSDTGELIYSADSSPVSLIFLQTKSFRR